MVLDIEAEVAKPTETTGKVGRVLLVVNRRARRGEAAGAEAADVLRAGGLTVEQRECRHANDLPAIIREEADAIDAVVIGGGDGTFIRVATARAPHLRAMVFDLPAVAARARARNGSL